VRRIAVSLVGVALLVLLVAVTPSSSVPRCEVGEPVLSYEYSHAACVLR
jgi:hypothetical protein